MQHVVDLYKLRCAVAALVHARHHIDTLQPGDIERTDLAVRHLKAVAHGLHGELEHSAHALLTAEPDPAGRRTTAAIDRLAALTHVDTAAAPALASSLRAKRPIQQSFTFAS